MINYSDADEEDDCSEDLRYYVYTWGFDAQGQLVCVRNREYPFFYIRNKDLEGVSVFKLTSWCKRMLASFDGFHGVQELQGKPFIGHQSEDETFLKLSFNSQKGMRYVSKALRSNGIEHVEGMDTYETHLPPVIRALHKSKATGWCQVEGTPADTPVTLAEVEFQEASVKPIEKDTFAPAVVATFDIEVYSSQSTAEDPVFPSALNEEDVIVAIVTTYTTITDPEPFYVHVLTLPAADLPDDHDYVVCQDERELLNRWAAEIVSRKATIWIHFNGLGFDEEYMYTRAVRVGAQELLHIGWMRDRQEPVELRKSSMESAAYGHNSFAYLVVEGVFHLDLMVAIKKDFNLQSYSLNYCGEYFCGQTKIDLPPQKQFDLYRAGKMRDILEYCIQDVRLTLLIATKLSMVTALVEMAGQTSVPVDFLITRGQQIKMMSRYSLLGPFTTFVFHRRVSIR